MGVWLNDSDGWKLFHVVYHFCLFSGGGKSSLSSGFFLGGWGYILLRMFPCSHQNLGTFGQWAMGSSYRSDQAILEKPLFSVRLAEVAIFCIEISTWKTTHLPNYWVTANRKTKLKKNWFDSKIDPLGWCLCPLKSVEFMPKKKVGSHVQKSK